MKKRAKSSNQLKAIQLLESDYQRYEQVVSELKKHKPSTGYRGSAERDMDYKFKTRSEEKIKSLKQFLQTVQYHKSDSLIFYYILSYPARNWDYYHGESQGFLSFDASEWKRKYVKILLEQKQ